MRPPAIETVRLRLRPFRLEDAATVRRLAGAREIADTTLLIPHPYPEGAAEKWIATHEAERREGTGLTLAIELRGQARLCGAIGLRIDSGDRRAELGYWVAVADWGRGYATEAARALLDYGFGVLCLHRVFAVSFARNPASGRVLEKIGMKREGVLREHVRKWNAFEDLVTWGILRSEWDARPRR